MFKEIIELGERLESEGKLVPSGFYSYKEPIKWIVHIIPGPPLQCHIEETELPKSRPKSGRTKHTDLAHPIADEAGYVFGIERKKNGIDGDAEKKHEAFKTLLDKMSQDSEVSKNQELKESILSIKKVSSEGILKSDKRFDEIMNKDWVSFVIESGSLEGKHIFELPEVKAFWIKELEATSQKSKKRDYEIKGDCSICGEPRQLLKRMPGVKLYKPIPLHSYNEDAFVSFIDGADISMRAHIGQCFICSDSIARTLNHLRENPLYHKIIVQVYKDANKKKPDVDSAKNQLALFWLKDEQPVNAGEAILDPAELLKNVSLILDRTDSNDKNTPPPDLMQLDNMLSTPWTGRDASVNIADNAFYLLILSPNKGRIAVRDWLDVSLDRLQQNLKAFLDAQRIIDPAGKERRCFGIPEILKAVEATNISKEEYKAVEIGNPNVSRQLLRTAYLGEPPPSVLLETAVMCMRNPKIFDEKKRTTHHILMATLKMILTHKKEGMKEMETLDATRNNIGYLCGQLLSILEEAQLRPVRWKINTTLVDRFYGSASSAPASVFGTLVRRATTDHFPKIRKQQLGYKDLEAIMESVTTKIDLAGGYPKTLSLKEQAEFSLGFYHQRAKFSANRNVNKQTDKKEEGSNEQQ
jgi:CRISPR-associated protein Csd1